MAYTKVNWKDLPDTSTPINADNLNTMDGQIEANANAIEEITSNFDNFIQSEIYSTSEVKTNKKWINGKPIYRKVLTFTQTTTNNTTIQHYIENVDLIYIERAFIYSSNGLCWDIPTGIYGNDNTTDRINLYVDKNVVGFKCDTTWNTSWTKVVMLEYTKTSD